MEMKALKEFNGYKGVFAFRIDLDFFHPGHVMNTLRVAEKHGIKTSWFINMHTGQYHGKEIKRIAETQDVQNHGFLHEQFKSEGKALESIKKADELLQKIGVKSMGFAAPFGKWGPYVGAALQKTGYSYSSEFREGKNILPFYPTVNGKKSKVLQVPVHPICLGELLENCYSPKEAVEYFGKVIDLFYRKQIPIFLYGHPTGRLGKNLEVLDRIFSKAKELDDVWFTTLTEYALFWKRKRFKAKGMGWSNHAVFFENRCSTARKAAMVYRGLLLGVEKRKIARRHHR